MCLIYIYVDTANTRGGGVIQRSPGPPSIRSTDVGELVPPTASERRHVAAGGGKVQEQH